MPLPTIDGAIVRRSAAALERYGPDFTYGHHLVAKRLATVAALGRAGSARSPLLAPLPPTRKLLLKIKSPGRGADEAERAKSWFKVTFVGEGGGKRVVTEVSGGDPGYGETSKMLAESALCLAFDELPETRRPGDHRGGDGRRAAGAAAAGRDLLPRARAGFA